MHKGQDKRGTRSLVQECSNSFHSKSMLTEQLLTAMMDVIVLYKERARR